MPMSHTSVPAFSLDQHRLLTQVATSVLERIRSEYNTEESGEVVALAIERALQFNYLYHTDVNSLREYLYKEILSKEKGSRVLDFYLYFLSHFRLQLVSSAPLETCEAWMIEILTSAICVNPVSDERTERSLNLLPKELQGLKSSEVKAILKDNPWFQGMAIIAFYC